MKNSRVKNFALLATLVMLLVLPIAVSQVKFPMRIENPRTLDERGNVETNFMRGDLVLVEATVVCPFEYYAPPEYRFMYIVKFVDRWGVTFYYGVVYGTLQPGKSATYVVGGKIPENAPLGTYTAHIYVWSNWPAAGTPSAYAESITVTFNVGE